MLVAFFIDAEFLFFDRTVLRYQNHHQYPGKQIRKAADAEHHEVACWLAGESEESKAFSGLLGEGEERTCTLLDKEASYTSCHSSNACNRGNCTLREHISDSGEKVG